MAIAAKLKAGVRSIAAGFVVLFIFFIGLKGCVVTVWMSPKLVETYEITGDDGRSMRLVFFAKERNYHLVCGPDSRLS